MKARFLLFLIILFLCGIFVFKVFSPDNISENNRPKIKARENIPTVNIPSRIFKEIKKKKAIGDFKGVIIHYGGAVSKSSVEKAISVFDLVLCVPSKKGEGGKVFLGKRWNTNPGGGSKELHVIWLGKDVAKAKAMIVKLLEGTLSVLNLSRDRVRLHGELPWARTCKGPIGNKCLKQPINGELLRSWIRGVGSRHKKKER